MSNKKPAELSDEELIRNEKRTKVLVVTFVIILTLLFVTVILLIIKKGFTPLIATAIALVPVCIVSMNNWKELKKEIKLRKL
jgi:CHASE2 domain-containing sensor protein